MEPLVASRVVALRPGLEALIVKACVDPDGISQPMPNDDALMKAVRGLSRPKAGRHGIVEEEG